MARIAYDALMDKKAQDVRVINIENVSSIADYFLIASGTNRTQVMTLADNVDEMLGRAGYEKKQVEGYASGNWILLDYGDIIVHIFDRENRLFYDLEKIWRDGKLISPEELGTEGE
jgi:ribosome-associated protein